MNKNQLSSPEDDRLVKVALETSTAVDRHGRRDMMRMELICSDYTTGLLSKCNGRGLDGLLDLGR